MTYCKRLKYSVPGGNTGKIVAVNNVKIYLNVKSFDVVGRTQQVTERERDWTAEDVAG